MSNQTLTAGEAIHDRFLDGQIGEDLTVYLLENLTKFVDFWWDQMGQRPDRNTEDAVVLRLQSIFEGK